MQNEEVACLTKPLSEEAYSEFKSADNVSKASSNKEAATLQEQPSNETCLHSASQENGTLREENEQEP